jgi:outer membrane phospholipase A
MGRGTRHWLRWLLVALATGATSARADWFCSGNDENRQPVVRLFSPHDETYIITGFPSDREKSTNQVKFQLSFKFDLLPNEGPCGFFFGYTQLALWKVWAYSAPLDDINYNPQFFFVYGAKDLDGNRKPARVGAFNFLWARLGVEHESNGKEGPDSRSWDRLFVSARFAMWFGGRGIFYFTLEPKAWLPRMGGGNPDLADYIGYGQLTTELGWHSVLQNGHWQDLMLGLFLRKGTVGSRGTLQLTLQYRPPWFIPSLSLYGQAFFGYGETLLHYNERTTAFRIGIAFDDRFSWKTGRPAGTFLPPPP